MALADDVSELQLDQLPSFDAEALPALFDEPHRTTKALGRERTLTRRSPGRRHRDARRLSAARDVVTELPRAGESLHLLHVGHFDGIDLLTVALELVGDGDHLRVASLGVNDRTLEALASMLDRGRVRTVTLLLSHYFSHVDQTLYGRTHAELTRRGGRVAIARSHAKVWTFGPYSFEGSGNLRSCKSLEQLTIVNDAELAAFHAAWIDELVAECLKENRPCAAGSQRLKP